MARGWDPGNRFSTRRIECANPPGPGGIGAVGAVPGCPTVPGCQSGFRPNVLVGHCPFDLSGPEIGSGLGAVSDVSLEVWWHWKIISSITTTQGDWTGLFHTHIATPTWSRYNIEIPHNWAGLPWTPTSVRVAFDPDTTVAGQGSTPGYTLEVPMRWSHIAMNFDRSGNGTAYINGVLVATFNLAACVGEVFEACRYYAITVGSTLPALYNGTFTDLNTYDHGRYVVGPTAFHTRLMTLNEIQSSYRGKRVQNFRTPNTILYYDWRGIERIDGCPLCWDFEEDNTHHHTLVGVQGRGIGLPLGAPGAVRVPDLSGAGNDWIVPTLALYQRTPALNELSSTAFMVDPFWSN